MPDEVTDEDRDDLENNDDVERFAQRFFVGSPSTADSPVFGPMNTPEPIAWYPRREITPVPGTINRADTHDVWANGGQSQDLAAMIDLALNPSLSRDTLEELVSTNEIEFTSTSRWRRMINAFKRFFNN